jgi:hypothetical protein
MRQHHSGLQRSQHISINLEQLQALRHTFSRMARFYSVLRVSLLFSSSPDSLQFAQKIDREGASVLGLL